MRKRGFTLVVLVIVVSLGTVALAASSALASGDANEGVCPNEGNTGFTSALPDCRAYEQVSPEYKDGFPVSLEYLLAEGDRVRVDSYGLFAGAIEYPLLAENQYDLARIEGGWVATALNDLPLAEFGYGDANPILLAADGASLMQIHPTSRSVYERDFYVHEPNGGAFVPVGPLLPPYAVPSSPTGSGEYGGPQGVGFVGATKSFSHVLFTLRATPETHAPGVTTDLWPGDSTHLSSENVSSLYEYAGEGNTAPTLVGVDNSGHPISDCGTAPGGWDTLGEGNHLNAMSEDGTRVFFTAVGAGEPSNPPCAGASVVPPVDELFARENASHTVALSEPAALSPSAPEPDEGCSSTACRKDITETANFRDASFEKASSEGSKVFFSSTQQLLNGATQDGEANDSAVPRGEEKGCQRTTVGANGCNLYEYDFGGDPTTEKPVGLVLVSKADSPGVEPEVQGVAAVSEDGSHVYFVARGVLTHEPRASATGECLMELSPAEMAVEAATKEGRCRPKRGAENLYVYNTTSDGSSPEFVATLAETDASQWKFNGIAGPMNVTDDGKFIVFTSTEHLVADDASTVQQVFRYEAATGPLVRVSLGNEGHDGLGASAIAHRDSREDEPVEGDAHPAVSEDGTSVVFSSSEALTPEALNNKCVAEENGACAEYAYNIYEYREGRVYLISRGVATSEAPVISQQGKDIFFQTVEQLVTHDIDTLPDIYDARSGGGFAAFVSQMPCGDVCQGPFPAAPAFAAPGTASASASGNLPPTPVAPKPKAKPLTRSQKLTKALKLCHAKRGKKARTSCESAARRKYGSQAKKSSSDRRSGR